MSSTIDNRETIAINFYYYKEFKSECIHCSATENLCEINDGHETKLCFDCLNRPIGELRFSDDYSSNDFNREKVPMKRFGKGWK